MRFSDFLLVSNPTDLDFIVGYTDEQNIRINVLDLFAGQIIGGGTPGYVPVFTAENVIDDSVIFQHGTNIVIGGVDSLGYKLAVNGSLYASNGAVINSTALGADALRVIAVDGDIFVIPNDSGQPISSLRRIAHPPAVLATESATLGQLNTAISNLEGDIEILLDLKVDKSSVGEPNGVASLDATGKIPLSEIPDSIIGQVEYMGTWNAFTNTPTLNPLIPEQKGHYYVVSAAGVFGGVDYQVGDWIISNGVEWQKVDNTDAVTSVFGRIGAILALEADYQSFYPRLSQSYDNPTWINTLAFSKITGVPPFLLENQTVTLSGDVTGSGKTSIASTISNNAVTDSKLRDSVGTSVIGRASSTTGDPADIQASTDGHVLQRSGGTLLFGLISSDSIGSIDWSKIINTPTTLSGYGITNAYTKTEADNKFVPYTGANANVNLGSNNITANAFVKAGGTSAQFLKADGSVDVSQYVPTTRSVNAGTGLTGGGNLSSDVTLAFDTTWGDTRYAYRTRQLTINGTTYDLSADRTWNVGTVTSVGLSMPSAFTVSNSPITSSGTIGVSAAGTAAQYIRGDGTLADFPNTGGGGSSVSYYLNGSVNQGTLGGNTYYEMSKTPILGAGTDFSISADGYISQFITDAGDPNLLEIPAGNWNFETYFSASSGGGTPTFYIELYKYNGTTFTLIASNSTTPELIAFGTTINPYFSALAVPQTPLLATDRLAIRIYVNTSGRTITLHTEDNHLCQIITTFTTGLTALNGLTAQVQYFQTGTSGTDFNISSSVATHTFNLPTASATNRGALSSSDWTTFNNKIGGTLATGQVAFGTAANTIGGDNGLFWDNTNKRLGVGTNVPSTKLDIQGDHVGTIGLLRLNSNLGNISAQTFYINSVYKASVFVDFSNDFNIWGRESNIIFSTGTTITDRWRITSTGVLQSNGAQTIQTSTGNLTLATAAGNGNILLAPNGTGVVDVIKNDRANGAELRITNAFNASGWVIGDIVGTLNFVSSDTSNPQNIRSQIQSLVTDTVGTYASRVALVFSTADLSTLAERWRITSTGVLQSNGAQTIQTSTGLLSLQSNGGNVGINTTTDAGFRLDVNGTARVQGVLTTTADAVVNGMNIGLGGGAVNTNVRVGLNALNANTTGFENVALGRQSLTNNTTGFQNTALGNQALLLLTTGNNNIAIGNNSLLNGQTQSENVSIGGTSLLNHTTGNRNVSIGHVAARYISDKTTNLTNSSNSIFIGYRTTPSGNAETNQIVIGHDSTGLGSNTTVIGNSSTSFGRWFGNLLLGSSTNSGQQLQVTGTTLLNGLSTIQGTTASDTAPLGSELATTGSGTNWTGTDFATGYTHVVGSTASLTTSLAAVVNIFYQITYTVTGRTAGSFTINYGGTSTTGLTATGATGPLATSTATLEIVPTTDFNGTIVLSVRTIGTSSATTTFNDSGANARIEVRATSSTNNTIVGRHAGRRTTTGSSNSLFGFQSGQNITTAISNSFFGFNSGLSNTTGNNNSFFGAIAGRDNTTGVFNSFFGQSAGAVNTTGSSNSFFGLESGRSNTTASNNSFFGVQSGRDNTTGGSNSFFGTSSGAANTTGVSNAFIGTNAGLNNTTGSLNCFFGINAGRFLADGTTSLTIANNSVFLGRDTRANADNETNQIVIGANSIGLGSNTTVIGNSSTSFGRWFGSLLLGTSTNVASSIFTMSSTTQGFLPPRMTQAQRTAIASPAEGLIVFQTDSVIGLYIYANATWRSLTMV